jgi:DNA mismatch repair protein MutS
MAAEPQRAPHRFQSVLFCGPEAERRGAPPEPDYFVDLNLDQVLRLMTSGREEYDLAPFFYAPLREPGAVHYRHGVLHDLEQPEVLEAVRTFAEGMRKMREHLELAGMLYYELQREAWFVSAVEIYGDAVRALSDDLATVKFVSDGFNGLREYLAEYAASERFTLLLEETRALKEALASIRYSVLIRGGRVTVTKYAGDADYSEEVQDTFARFRQGWVTSYRVSLPNRVEMNQVEARILDGVAELHPEVFASRADYCAPHRGYLDRTIARFDREIQFYLAYLELIGRLQASGLRFSYPVVSADSKEVRAVDTFDLALAYKLVSERREVVCNDFYLEEPERMFVVSGPNNGGKTTFARTFGQLHHLAGLGLLVPGAEARLFLSDRIYTHFEREEDIETLRGKFDEELVRVHSILGRASPQSVIVMNESFNSTTLNDALFVGTEVMRRILDLGCLGVYVTFVDELASLTEATVSMVSQVVPGNAAERTFKVVRQPADGLAYAWALADKYGLTYERVTGRVGG